MDLYGPPLPPGYRKPNEDEESECEYSAKELNSAKVIGPQCPSFLLEKSEEDSSANTYNKSTHNDFSSIGPQLPPHLLNFSAKEEDNSFDNVCGPLPCQIGEENDDLNERKAAIEKRAVAMKDKLDNKTVPTKLSEREEWMMIPDTSSRNQLGAISRCLAPSKPSKSSKDRLIHSDESKNERTTTELKQYNKSRRSESLLEQHTKKLKEEEKKKKHKSKEERKAFDREEIAVRHFTKNQVNSVIEKAKYLNSRFAAGNKHYL